VNELLLKFAEWLAATQWSIGLHESFYLFNWLESTHVLTLALSLGALCIVDLRMLGWCLPNVPATKVAQRMAMPMLIGFSVMFVTGVILYTSIPVRYTQSIWFRIKLLLLVVAALNAWLFHRHMNRSVGSWDTAPVPPPRTRTAAATSLGLWALIVICGRFIAYDWFDCGKADSAFINWAVGCAAGAIQD
jgi:hypothetical protein